MVALMLAEKTRFFDVELIREIRNTLFRERYLGHIVPKDELYWEKKIKRKLKSPPTPVKARLLSLSDGRCITVLYILQLK
jgi:hypothetical protein